MGRGFGVGDLDGLTGRLRDAGEDLDDAAKRISGLCVGRHGILNPATAAAVHIVWADWAGTAAQQASRCRRLAATVAQVSREYRATDCGIAGYPEPTDAPPAAAVGGTRAQTGPVDIVDGPLNVDPGEVFAGMVAACGHLSIDIDTIAHTIAALPQAVDWWGSAADAAFAAIRDLSRDVAATAAAIDALRDVCAGYSETVWPPAGIPISAVRVLGVDPGRHLAAQARGADTQLRDGIAAWTAPHHAATDTVGDARLGGRRLVDSPRRVTILTAANTGRDQPPTPTGSLMVAHQPPSGTYRVVPGDTLWAIARRTLGDARRWRDIFDLNEGRRQRDGRTLTDPRLILPGWRLQLPKTTRPTPVPRPGRMGGNPPPPAAAPTRPTPPTATPTTTATPPPQDGSAAHAAHANSAWPLVEVGLGAATLGAGAGWIAGRRHRTQPATAVMQPPRHAGATAAGWYDPPAGSAGPATHTRNDPASSPHPGVPTAPNLMNARTLPTDPSPLGPADDPLASRTTDPHQPLNLPPRIEAIARWPDDWIPVGRGLVGPGGAAAARAMLLDALTRDRAGAGRVIVTAAAMTLLLPGDPVSAETVPGLAIADGLTAALDHLDQEILTRSRATDDDAITPADDGDLAAGNGSWPPLLVIVEAPPTAERVRLAAILLQGIVLGIDAVILGRWPSGDTITVSHDGHFTPVDESGPDAPRQLPITDIETARTLLRSLASTRPGSSDELLHPAAPDSPPTAAPVSSPSVVAPDAASLNADPRTTPIAPRNTVPETCRFGS